MVTFKVKYQLGKDAVIEHSLSAESVDELIELLEELNPLFDLYDAE